MLANKRFQRTLAMLAPLTRGRSAPRTLLYRNDRMSKNETPMIRWYWNQIGGTLVEEFPAVCRTALCGQRLLDAIILPKRETRIAQWRSVTPRAGEGPDGPSKIHRMGLCLLWATFSFPDVW